MPRRNSAEARALARYRSKRDFRRTPEPAGRAGAQAGAGIFVVQEHAASRLHYDFRLELDGTLKSWAVPKGPSLDPAQKRLAVHVEDHPLDYAQFEGIIPPKQYGAGTVLLWDRGRWHPTGDAKEGYRKGVLKFRLQGDKLRGGWTLVRMGRPSRASNDKDHWLLIKEADEEARRGKAGDIVTSHTKSVASGRDLHTVARERSQEWQSNRKQASKRPTNVLSDVLRDLEGAIRTPCPEWVAPQLATLVDAVPGGDDWIHEIKYDGYRIVCRVQDGTASLWTRNRNDWTDKLRPQAKAVEALAVADAWLDGEVVVLTPQGTSDFQALQNAFDLRLPSPIVYCLFDLLYVNGCDLRQSPLIERKRALAALLGPRSSGDVLRYSDHLAGDGRQVFAEACRQGLEGLIAKRADGPYRSGRTRSWLKIKCEQRQEFVIGGYTDPAGSRRGFGALLVGVYDDGTLRYAGKVGTGFSEVTLGRMTAKLKRLAQADPPFANPPTGFEAKGVHWVRPELVGEVRFAEWTKEGLLRHPSFQGLRLDKPARVIGHEEAQSLKDASSSPRAPVAGRRRTKAASPRGAGVTLTHPDRVLYPDLGLTKDGLARYYDAVAEWMLPHLQGRPLTLVRCPEGYQDCFYQKHVHDSAPKALGRVQIEEDGGVGTYVVADTREALLGLVQMGVLELHTWGATRDRLDRPDRLTFDLDPDEAVPWTQVIEAAQLVKTLLDELGLTSFVKTTGGKGLHVVTPIQRTLSWEDAKAFSKAIAEHLVAMIPQRFTAALSKRARKNKIFIDYLRNARGATAIAAYSTRARPGAPVSMPLAWHELSADLESDHFTVGNTPDRLTSLRRDPWAGYAEAAARVTERMRARMRRAA